MITLFKNLLSDCKGTKSFNNSLMNKDKILITQSYFSCRRPWSAAPRCTRRTCGATPPKGRCQSALRFAIHADSTRNKTWFDSKHAMLPLETHRASTRSTPRQVSKACSKTPPRPCGRALQRRREEPAGERVAQATKKKAKPLCHTAKFLYLCI